MAREGTTATGEAAPTPFERLGGREAVARLVDAFYDRIEADPELRPLFPADLAAGRERQKWFFEQWLGGEPLYSRRRGPPALRRRHLPFAIAERDAERWLAHFGAALDACGADAGLARDVLEALRPVARRIVNTVEVGRGPPRRGG